jgi:hypothetical protein
MRVLPVCERSLDLHVTKLPALDVVQVLSNPLRPKWSKVHAHHRASAVLDPARTFQHLDPLPRRRKPLERTGSRMPAKDLFCGSLDT